MKCKYESLCGGCDIIELPYEDQLTIKKTHLSNALHKCGVHFSEKVSFQVISPLQFQSRDRIDFIAKMHNGETRLGLYKKEKTDRSDPTQGVKEKSVEQISTIDNREILNIDFCPQMSPNLSEWYLEFKNRLPKLKIGSFRLRVSPSGKRGVWIDLPNEDVKFWLEEKKWLESLLSMAVVEIGQRRKRLTIKDGQLKLSDPQPAEWFETYLYPDLRKASLQSLVGSFTQPGFKVNKSLVKTVLEFVQIISESKWLELGSGVGNFTLPLASFLKELAKKELKENKLTKKDSAVIKSSVYELNTVEIDENAIDCAMTAVKSANLEKIVNFHRINFHKPTQKLMDLISSSGALLVDPPRSGLRGTLEIFEKTNVESRPSHIIYVSCFADSFAQDVSFFTKLGYELSQLALVDQFPQSSHYEIVAHLRMINSN